MENPTASSKNTQDASEREKAQAPVSSPRTAQQQEEEKQKIMEKIVADRIAVDKSISQLNQALAAPASVSAAVGKYIMLLCCCIVIFKR